MIDISNTAIVMSLKNIAMFHFDSLLYSHNFYYFWADKN